MTLRLAHEPGEGIPFGIACNDENYNHITTFSLPTRNLTGTTCDSEPGVRASGSVRPMTRVLMPLPCEDFEPTEAAVPWRVLKDAGIEVVFATPDGTVAACDPKALAGVVFGQIGAKARDAATYREMAADPAFTKPISYASIDVTQFDALHLPGGHAPGMRPYLESTLLQEKAVEFFQANKLVSAICHGPIVLARAVDPKTGRSVLAGRRMTGLTKLLERAGFWLTVWTLGRRFRTYPAYVQDEVAQAQGAAGLFERGPLVPSYSNPFVVADGNLLTARWPGDAQGLAERMVERLVVASTTE